MFWIARSRGCTYWINSWRNSNPSVVVARRLWALVYGWLIVFSSHNFKYNYVTVIDWDLYFIVSGITPSVEVMSSKECRKML